METPPHVTLATPTVTIEGVALELVALVARLGIIHFMLFGTPLVVTSGKDSVHSAGSLHAQGKAVDVRTNDKSEEQNALFLGILAYTAGGMPLCYFDERQNPSGPHIHLEWHGA